MLKNFLTVALRSFLRQRIYSFMNILGLASGLVCALFIYLWVQDEVGKNTFHQDIDRIYQIVANMSNEGEVVTWVETPGPLADEIRSTIPDVEHVARLANDGVQLFRAGEKNFLERGYFADPDFFHIFSYPILQGSVQVPLPDKSSVAISQTLARKLFGDADPIGKVITVQNKFEQKVTAVFADVQSNSSYTFDFIMPFEVHMGYRALSWSNSDYELFVKLTAGANPQATITKINQHVLTRLKALGEELPAGANLYMQPFADRYLYSFFENGVPTGGRIKYVQIFSWVAIFILVIACINFMNMATARAATRSKEVGVRKVVGAQRSGLILQFIGESVLISAIAMVLALGMVGLLLPLFNALVEKQMTLNVADPSFLGGVVALVIITGLLAGSYPAFFLSSYRPASVLKGNMRQAFSGARLRSVLVGFQFMLTVVLIASALVVYSQLSFIRNKNVGYNRDAILYFSGRAAAHDFEHFRQQALQNPAIKNISTANEVLVHVNNQNNSIHWPGMPEDSQRFFRTVIVDVDFLETMGIQLVEGRSFSREQNDTSNVILTEEAVKVMGLTNPVGTKVTQWEKQGTVVGVAKDFHSRSLHDAISPVVFVCQPGVTSRIHVRFDPTKTAGVVASLEALYKKANPEFPFEYTFLDEEFEKLYNTEKITGSLALVFTGLAILISVLGLLGLAAYTAEKKKKEISIRKTLGASIPGIVASISGEFLRLNLIAAAIGCPLAYFWMGKFLDGYAYHTDLRWQTFAWTAVLVMIISFFTVVFQVVKAALANPVDALRNE